MAAMRLQGRLQQLSLCLASFLSMSNCGFSASESSSSSQHEAGYLYASHCGEECWTVLFHETQPSPSAPAGSQRKSARAFR